MLFIEHATARRLERAGIGLEEAAVSVGRALAVPGVAAKNLQLHRIEQAIGCGLVLVDAAGEDTRFSRRPARSPTNHLLLYASLDMGEGLTWDADALCGAPGILPETVVSAMAGLPLSAVVGHPDLPDARISGERPPISDAARIVVDMAVCRSLPVPTLRDRLRQRRSLARHVAALRCGIRPELDRRRSAIRALLMTGWIPIVYQIALLLRDGWTIHHDAVSTICSLVTLLVPLLLVRSVYENHPYLYAKLTLPYAVSETRVRLQADRMLAVGDDRAPVRWRPGSTVP